MARKDVDLIIRAKDQAKGVVKSITKALNEFNESQGSLNEGAAKSKSALGKLGAAISTLNQEAKGLNFGTRLESQLVSAGQGVERLAARVKGSEQSLSDLQRQFRNTSVETERYAAKLKGAEQAQERQRAALKRGRADLAAIEKGQKEAAAAQGRYTARIAKLPGLIEKQATALEKARARFADLSDEMAGTEKPSKTFSDSVERAGRVVANADAKLAKLTDEYQKVQGSLRAAGAAFTIFEGQARKASASLSGQETALSKIDQNVKKLDAATSVLSSQQTKLRSSVERATASLSGQTAALNQAEREYVDTAAAVGQAEQALKEFARVSLGSLEADLRKQRIETLRTKKSYLELSEQATRLATEIGRVGVPTREMAQEFALVKDRAAAAKAELAEQRVTLELMGRAYREAGTDIESIRDAQNRFATLLDGQHARVKKAKSELNSYVGELRQLDRASRAAATTQGQLASETNRNAAAARRAAGATGLFADAYRQFYGDTRKSLGLMQRLRGEVLSLIAAYGGIFAAVEGMRAVVNATQTLEGATARLNVVSGGSIEKTAQSMDFLRRTANRLGIDLGVLANEYSKFAVATKGTNLEGQNTRDIFLSVAEAARVNQSSTEEMSGVFKALTQIVSKGKVTAEELKEQLGDRLPGAIQIMADALGIGTDKLFEMLEAGEVTSEALIPFGEELNKRFGPQLANSLTSTATAFGKFRNAVFQAAVAFGEGGFIDSLNEFLFTLTEVAQSAAFITFLQRASSGVALLIDGLAILAENFQLVFAGIGALVGLKLTPFLFAFAAGFSRVSTAARGAATSAAAATVAYRATGVAAAGAAVGVNRLAGAFRVLLTSTGVGLAVTAGAAALGYWASSADAATDALVQHKKQVDALRNAYEETGGAVEAVRESVRGVFTVTEARENFDDIKAQFETLLSELTDAGKANGNAFLDALVPFKGVAILPPGYESEVRGLIDSFLAGKSTAEELRKQIDDVNEKFRDGRKDTDQYARTVIGVVNKLVPMQKALEEAGLKVRFMTEETEDAQEAIDELAGSTEDLADAVDRKANRALEDFNKAMLELQGQMDPINRGMSEFETNADGVFQALGKALEAARALPEAIQRIAAEQRALAAASSELFDAAAVSVDADFANITDGVEAAQALLRRLEGRIERPKYDVNAFRAGYGSDTKTNPLTGAVSPIIQGTTVSLAEAEADLKRRITTEFMPLAASAVGEGVFAALAPQQQAVLTSIAYNYGKLPQTVVDAVKTGSTDQVVAAIKGLGARGRAGKSDEEGARKRTAIEAALYGSTSNESSRIAVLEREAEARRRLRDEAAKTLEEQRAATLERIADGQFEIDQQELINQSKERQAAIEAEIREAKKENPGITQAEIEEIARLTGEQYDLQNAVDATTRAKERAAEADQRVNDLLEKRTALEEQLDLARDRDDAAKMEEVRLKIAEVNEELIAAVDNATRMHEALGGTAAETSIIKLENLRAKAQQLETQATQNFFSWRKVGDLFLNGLTTAVGSFSKAVAEGKSIGEAARIAFLQFASDFLIQIAQMIAKQAIFNALKGTAFGGFLGIGVGTGHTGGIVGSKRVGSGNSTRVVSPAIFAGASRYHSGGIAGLRPNEVPIIAEKGERIMTEAEQKAMRPAGKTRTDQKQDVEVRNFIDPVAFFEAGARTDSGRRIIFNIVKSLPRG